MQYPIIDLITDAYINNGWTGLDIVEGKNLFLPSLTNSYNQQVVIARLNVSINNDDILLTPTGNNEDAYVGGLLFTDTANNPTTFTCPITSGETYTITVYEATGKVIANFIQCYKEDGTVEKINGSSLYERFQTTITFTAPSNAVNCGLRIGLTTGQSGITYNVNIQIEKGTESTAFEPYRPPTTDIFSRLKLPLPHYFPHPVIDALQRAAAGTQTADDTEILQHYLTPLGIGGI